MFGKIVYDNPFVLFFFAGTFLSFFVEHLLDFLNWRARLKNGGKIPGVLEKVPAASLFDGEKLKKSAAYNNAGYFLRIPHSAANLALDVFLVVSGFYPWLFNVVCRITGTPGSYASTLFSSFLFVVLMSVPGAVISLPFDLYGEFKIEKDFGFSKMTLKIWILDAIKGFFVSLSLVFVLVSGITLVLKVFPNRWWIFLTCLLFFLTLVMQVLYPLVIAPLFNKFIPLEDGELKEKISALMEAQGFRTSGIFVMDASKRSGHSNAYFVGFGKSKRIVIYDTLIEQLSVEELSAVLAHELGHYKLRHIIRRFAAMVPFEFAAGFLLYLCANTTSLYTGFGFAVSEENVASMQFIGIMLSSMVFSPLGEFFSPVSNFFFRRDEFQADRFSMENTKDPGSLSSALVKLSGENLGDLNPSKLYVMWNYSHPTLAERVGVLNRSEKMIDV